MGTVVVNVVSPLVGMGNDSDGLGFSDCLNIAAGVDPSTSSPLGGAAAARLSATIYDGPKTANQTQSCADRERHHHFQRRLAGSAGFSPPGK